MPSFRCFLALLSSRLRRVKLAVIVLAVFMIASSSRLMSASEPLSSASVLLPGQAIALLSDGSILFSGGLKNGHVVREVDVQSPSGELKQLPNALLSARRGHTATVLPDGNVLIFGGTDDTGAYVQTIEIYDPATQTAVPWEGLQLVPRKEHTATLLSDGLVLVVGGTEEGGALPNDLQTWDYRTGKIVSFDRGLQFPRQGHTARLLQDGSVLVQGGIDSHGQKVTSNEVWRPEAQVFQQFGAELPASAKDESPVRLSASLPASEATDVAIWESVKLRFSSLVDVRSFTSATVILQNQDGLVVPANIVAAEDGRLGFITPTTHFASGTSYRLTIRGLKDSNGQVVPRIIIRFSTAAADEGDNGWTPDAVALNGNWNSRTGLSEWQKLPNLSAPKGVTALAGQVLGISGKPLQHVTLAIENDQVETDATGRFLLKHASPGQNVLVIKGQTANHGEVQFGEFEVAVTLVSGKTTTLNYTIWMTKLDTAHPVHLASPTSGVDTVVSSPLLPGLELHLPAGTTIVDRTGKTITDLTITPIPLDKPPFPLPTGLRVPLYFTIQPGGAEIRLPRSSGPLMGARLFYPNSFSEPAGMNYNFWNYDAASKGWYIYGNGHVTKNKKQITPDPGVFVYELTGAMVGGASAKPTVAGGGPGDGDPVSLASGQFTYGATDLRLPDIMPIRLSRTYIANDHYQRAFGVGTTNDLDMFMVGDKNPYTYQELVLPSGQAIRFNRTSSGTGSSDAVYTSTSTQGRWYGANLMYSRVGVPYVGISNGAWSILDRFGNYYLFPDSETQDDQLNQALLGIIDRNGNATVLTRDSHANLTKINSSANRWISLSYDAQNRVSSASDNSGRSVSYTYDSGGRLATVTDVRGGVATYSYDSNDLMLSITDARNTKYLQNQYDSFGRVTLQTMADGGQYSFAWTPSNNSTQQWTTTTQPVDPNNSGAYEGYTGLISQVSITDPRGYVRNVAFNNLGMMTSDTRALGQNEQQSTTYQYRSDNTLQSISDPLGRLTTFTYDSLGNTTGVTRLAGTSNAVTTSATYGTTYSNLLSVTDPLNNATHYGYDAKGNLLTITDPLNHSTTFTYGGNGLLSSITDAVNNTTSLGYQGNDLLTVADPIGNVTTLFTDAIGRTFDILDPQNNLTQMQYDPAGHLLSITNPDGAQQTFGYDPNGNLLSQTDLLGNAVTYTYDLMDRVKTRTDPLSRQASVIYDLARNPVAMTDRRGITTSAAFDGLSRKTFVGYGTTTNGSTTTYDSSTTLVFDKGNRLTSAADTLSGTITHTYDGLDRLTNEASPQGSVAYTFDAAGRRSTMIPSIGSAVGYTFDNANRLTGLTQGNAQVSITYDSANRRNVLTLPNGVTAQYAFNQNSQLQSLAYSRGGTAIGTLNYTYDQLGNRSGVTGSLANINLPFAVSSATYDAANQLTSWGGLTASYDGNGNTVADISGSQFTWNSRNQLAGIGTSNTSFLYDAFNRRINKASGGQVTSFLYDGLNRVAESTAGLNTSLLPGGVDEYFLRNNGSVSVPLVDALGSVAATSDATGATLASYWYSPYGQTTVTGNDSNTNQFTGRENDGNGLYYYRARYLNAVTGRFLSQDPLGMVAGANVYSYVSNGPTNKRDPSGKFAVGAVIGGISGAYFGAVGATNSGPDADATDVFFGAVAGGLGGAALGFIDPSEGALSIAGGTAVGGLGDFAGQLAYQYNHNGELDFSQVNLAEIGGASLGGAFGGAFSSYLEGAASAALLSGKPLIAAQAILAGNAGLIGQFLGGSISFTGEDISNFDSGAHPCH